MMGMQAFALSSVPTFTGMAEGDGMLQPRLINEVMMLAARVKEHFKRMGASWK